ncbi:MAG: alpha/beta fold hydrolase [Lachnospiraceae bacterium]|nr:alpha/beta fold hydrolase [Lachnospiraceae bacterium]
MIYNKITVNGIQIFYRECGRTDKPVMVLFHGFPSASHMFRDLMPLLEDKYHLVAPDYPGFGQSEKARQERRSPIPLTIWRR